MKSLKDEESIKKINIQNLLKYGKHIYEEEKNFEFDPDYYGIGIGTAYIHGKELVLQKENFEGFVNPDWFDANNFGKEELNKTTETIYFDEKGQMHENIEDLEEKVYSVIEGANEKFNNMSKHRVINFLKTLFSKKKLLEDKNSLTFEEIEARLEKVTKKEKNFMDNYSTEKTDFEKNLDAKKVIKEKKQEIEDKIL